MRSLSLLGALLLDRKGSTVTDSLRVRGGTALRLAGEAALLPPALALEALLEAGTSVGRALSVGALSDARRRLARDLVSRDTSALGGELIASAAIEPMAENLCDSVVAPACAHLAAGLPRAWVYRVVNTADAMFSYRTDELLWYGKPAARANDALNLLPARSRRRGTGGGAGPGGRLAWRRPGAGGGCGASRSSWPPAAGEAMTWRPPEPDPRLAAVPLEAHGGPGDELGGDRPPVVVDLSTNVNPFLPDPEVGAAVVEIPLGRYPDPVAVEARRSLTATWHIPPERILLGPGAAELIHRVARCFVRRGDPVVVAGPTFGEYGRAARLQGGIIREVRGELPDLALDLEAVAQEIREVTPPLAFLCTPNNPTGEAVHGSALSAVVEALPPGTLLVLDESLVCRGTPGAAPPAGRRAGPPPPVLHQGPGCPGPQDRGRRGRSGHSGIPDPGGAPVAGFQPGAAGTDRRTVRGPDGPTRREPRHRPRAAPGPRRRAPGPRLGPPPLHDGVRALRRRLGGAGVREAPEPGDPGPTCRLLWVPGHIRVAAGRPDDERRFLDTLDRALPAGSGCV